MPVLGIGRKLLACVLAAGSGGVLLSLSILSDPQLRDYALLVAEVGIGLAIAIALYGISRNNENKLRAIAANTDKMVQAQAKAGRDMEKAAERRLAAILREIDRAADGVIKSKQLYDAGTGAKRFEEIVAECAGLEKAAKELTDTPQSVYWAEKSDAYREIYGLCEKGPSYIDGDIDVSFCESVKTKTREQSKELGARLEPPAARPAPLSVRSDRDSYPPRSTIYASVRIDPPLRNGLIECEILDRGGVVVARRDLDARRDPDLGQQGVFGVSFEAGGGWEAGEYAIKARCGGQAAESKFSIVQSAPSISTDRDVYAVGSDMTVTVEDPDANRDGKAAEHAGNRPGSKLVVESRRGRITGLRLQETGPCTGRFEGRVNIAKVPAAWPPIGRWMPASVFAKFGWALGRRKDRAGRVECGRGEEITLRYENGADTAVRTVRTAGAAVDLDRDAYTCTGRVRITVTVSDYAGLSLGGTPAKGSCRVSVKTSIGSLAGYKLDERGPGSRVFEGSVRLTGFSEMEGRLPSSLPFGTTGGEGPDDGMLACARDDEVEVAVEAGGKLCRKAASTRWNQGRVDFLAPSYAIGDFAAVRVEDPDMSLDPDAAGSFRISVCSDSDRKGIEIDVKETGPSSGVFDGRVALDYKRSSQKDAALLVSNGDTIYSSYTDVTPPSPDGPLQEGRMSSTAIISADRTVPPPLERMEIASISAESRKTGRGELAAGEPALIRVAVGGAKRPYAFTVFLQIEDSRGLGPAPLRHPGRINPQQTFECGFRWTPPYSGRFLLTVYLWKGLENPTAFCPPKEHSVVVGAASGAR